MTRLDRDALAAAAGTRDPVRVADLRVVAGAAPCVPLPGESTVADDPLGEGMLRITYRLRCTAPPTEIASSLVFAATTGHVRFVRVVRAGEAAVELLLTDDRRSAAIPAPTAVRDQRVLPRYLALGVRHIASGWDHLAFLFVLLLGARSIRGVVLAVTGFTVGHSVTLALAATSLVRPDAPAVEALVALTVALVAAENAWLVDRPRDPRVPAAVVMILLLLAAMRTVGVGPTRVGAAALAGLALFHACHGALLARCDDGRQAARDLDRLRARCDDGRQAARNLDRLRARCDDGRQAARDLDRLRAVLAALFGLLHGLAFAGTLAEAGLPPRSLAAALFGFNAGVEVGQLAIVAAAVLVARAAASLRPDSFTPSRRVLWTQAGSSAALALAVYWFAQRAF